MPERDRLSSVPHRCLLFDGSTVGAFCRLRQAVGPDSWRCQRLSSAVAVRCTYHQQKDRLRQGRNSSIVAASSFTTGNYRVDAENQSVIDAINASMILRLASGRVVTDDFLVHSGRALRP